MEWQRLSRYSEKKGRCNDKSPGEDVGDTSAKGSVATRREDAGGQGTKGGHIMKTLKVLKLGLSGVLFAIGLTGFLIVLKQGVLVSGDGPGLDPMYTTGWSLFFFLMLGVPCLLATVFGALPWIAWLREKRQGN